MRDAEHKPDHPEGQPVSYIVLDFETYYGDKE
jgi:hypothetical protein